MIGYVTKPFEGVYSRRPPADPQSHAREEKLEMSNSLEPVSAMVAYYTRAELQGYVRGVMDVFRRLEGEYRYNVFGEDAVGMIKCIENEFREAVSKLDGPALYASQEAREAREAK
jgi:hypothetical protein